MGGFFDSSQQSLVVDSLHIVAALLLAVGVAPGLRGGACVNSGVWRPRDWSPIIAPHAARSLDCLRVVISYNIMYFLYSYFASTVAFRSDDRRSWTSESFPIAAMHYTICLVVWHKFMRFMISDNDIKHLTK